MTNPETLKVCVDDVDKMSAFTIARIHAFIEHRDPACPICVVIQQIMAEHVMMLHHAIDRTVPVKGKLEE